MIVGFPGESDADFRNTMDALERIRFDQIFSFKFSPRPGTVAEKMGDQIPEDLKKARLATVHALQDSITVNYHKLLEGSAFGRPDKTENGIFLYFRLQPLYHEVHLPIDRRGRMPYIYSQSSKKDVIIITLC